jgi:hypothetical protein
VPVACSQSVLTGADAAIQYTPAGTQFCLLDFTDFPAGTQIVVPNGHDFRVGDPVVFVEEDGGNLDDSLTASTDGNLTVFYITAIAAESITVSATKGGAAITLNGDGGTGSADSAGHIKVMYGPGANLCSAKDYTLEISREELDITTLPCAGDASSGGKYAPFRATQPGYASGTGTMTIMMEDNDVSITNRLLDNIMLKDQSGAKVRFYVNALESSTDLSGYDLVNSSYVEADIRFTGMSNSVNPDDPQEASVTFTVMNVKRLFKTDLD